MTLLDLHVGRPVTRRGLSLFPVWTGDAVGADGDPGYDLLGDVVVGEHPDGAVVASLAVTNRGSRPALLLGGELLAGGQQHRVTVRTVVIDAQTTSALEVRCVEQGRWSGLSGHDRTGDRLPGELVAAADQDELWRRVRRYEQRHGASSTHSLLDAAGRADRSLLDQVALLRPLAGQTGVVVGVGGQPLLLEAFDSPRTFAQAWPGILRAATHDASTAAPVATPGRRARRFADRVQHVRVTRTSCGSGTALAGATEHARLRGLRWRSRTVHAVALNVRHDLVAV